MKVSFQQSDLKTGDSEKFKGFRKNEVFGYIPCEVFSL